jgi:hypothetical protein
VTQARLADPGGSADLARRKIGNHDGTTAPSCQPFAGRIRPDPAGR